MEEKSKSQKKRDAEALKDYGVALMELPLDILNQLPLTEPLKRALVEGKALTSHGAVRRQAQWIGKLMRLTDHDAIVAAYEAILASRRAQTASFHTTEQWRYRLIHEDNEALTAFISEYHPEDIQQLRQLVKKAKNPALAGASTALFRYLRLYVL